jgi:hypothetical protein
MSVKTGRPVSFFIFARIVRPFSLPTPRNDSFESRFALSYDALNTISTLRFAAMAASRSAIFMQSPSDSITHGPAMKKRLGFLEAVYLNNGKIIASECSFTLIYAFQLPVHCMPKKIASCKIRNAFYAV